MNKIIIMNFFNVNSLYYVLIDKFLLLSFVLLVTRCYEILRIRSIFD